MGPGFFVPGGAVSISARHHRCLALIALLINLYADIKNLVTYSISWML